MPDLPLQGPTVPEGFCNSLNDANWVQNLMNLIFTGVAKFEGSGFSAIINQATQPAVADRDKLWRDTDTGIIYNFSGGAWVSPHPELPSSDARRWWAGDLASLITYDGGTAGAVGANSGPMWEEDTDMQGRSPMHPGTVPSANPAKVLAVDENYGEGAHTMSAQEVAAHWHPLTSDPLIADGTRVNVVNTGAGAAGLAVGLTGPPLQDLAVANNTFTTVQQAMPVTHPVRGLYCIRRTGRINYVGS